MPWSPPIGNLRGPAGDAWPPPVTLADSSVITTNAADGSHFRVSITGNRTLGPPSNPTDGQRCVWAVTASGSDRTLTLSTASGGFAFGSDLSELGSIKAGRTDYIGAIYHAGAARWHVLAYSPGF